MSHMKNRDSNRRRREDRQMQAKVRQEAYDKLTVPEKLDKLGSLRALKQRAKFVKILEHEVALEDKAAATTDAAPAPVKEKKGAKARKQAKKDKKAS